MKKKKLNNVFTSNKNDCLFKEQFDTGERIDWNDDMPDFYKRLNKIEDDRSFVILASSVLEYEIDRFLKAFIPESQIIVNDKTNFVNKLNLVQAFRLIPTQLIIIANLIRNIRNDFAHNMQIDSFEDSEKSDKLPQHIKDMKRIWEKYSANMTYYSEGKKLILMFKDLWSVCVEGFRVYEPNVKLLRNIVDSAEFNKLLKERSSEFKNKDDKENLEKVLKIYMPFKK